MKTISVRQLAFSTAGTFLGAGFVSGQEIWLFFGCFGAAGFAGFLVTGLVCLALYYITLDLSCRTGTEELGRLLAPADSPSWIMLVDLLECLFLFGICVIMIAGAAALISGFTGLDVKLCGLIFTLPVLFAGLLGLRGLISAFSLLVPATTLLAAAVGVLTLKDTGFRIAPAAGSRSPLLPNWIVASLTYAAYNLFGNLGIISPFAPYLPDEGKRRRGLLWGFALLTTLAFSMIAPFTAVPEAGSTELPMETLALRLSSAAGIVYAVLMGFGMFSSCLGSIIAVSRQLTLMRGKSEKNSRIISLILLPAALLLSFFGFGKLVGTVYPVFGYMSIPFYFFLVIRYVRVRRSGTAA